MKKETIYRIIGLPAIVIAIVYFVSFVADTEFKGNGSIAPVNYIAGK